MNAPNYDQMTDAELSEAFAVRVAGCIPPKSNLEEPYWRDSQRNPYWIGLPPFATSADAVLPWLEKAGHGYFEIHHWSGMAGERPCYKVTIELHGEASAKTLARAACIALLRAKDAATSNV